jgi:hypothetical protein
MNEQRKEKSVRDTVETAIDLVKDNKSSSWDELADLVHRRSHPNPDDAATVPRPSRPPRERERTAESC